MNKQITLETAPKWKNGGRRRLRLAKFYDRANLQPDKAFKMTDGEVYVVSTDGAFVNLSKDHTPHKLRKREQRALKEALKKLALATKEGNEEL